MKLQLCISRCEYGLKQFCEYKQLHVVKSGHMQINKLDNSYSRLGIETVECGCNCVYEDTTSLIKPTAGYKTT